MPPHPSDAEPRAPADFARFLAAKEPVLLVGGQAVNLWALYYKDRVSDLIPFVSRDVDVLGDRETLEELARLAGAKPQFFPMKPPTNEVGVVIARDANGVPVLIQVLRGVLGVKNEELKQPAYAMKLGGSRVEVPGPITLLKAKIANVASINQSGRQDGRHVRIMCRVMPAYLEDLCESAASGRVDERLLIGFLEQLVKIVSTKTARRVFKVLQVDPRTLFAELEPGELSKLASFVKKRLPQTGLG